MNLTVTERLGLLSILPAEGNYATMRVLTELRSELGFSEADLKAANIREENGRTMWNKNGQEPKDIAIGEVARNIVVDALKAADDQKRLSDLTVPLYERFVINPE